MCRRKIVNSIVLFYINTIILTPGEYGSRVEMHRNNLGDVADTANSSSREYDPMFKMHWNSLGDMANTPNSAEFHTF
jgi:hypothetical protein